MVIPEFILIGEVLGSRGGQGFVIWIIPAIALSQLLATSIIFVFICDGIELPEEVVDQARFRTASAIVWVVSIFGFFCPTGLFFYFHF